MIDRWAGGGTRASRAGAPRRTQSASVSGGVTGRRHLSSGRLSGTAFRPRAGARFCVAVPHSAACPHGSVWPFLGTASRREAGQEAVLRWEFRSDTDGLRMGTPATAWQMARSGERRGPGGLARRLPRVLPRETRLGLSGGRALIWKRWVFFLEGTGLETR